jgi:hypothetical protein
MIYRRQIKKEKRKKNEFRSMTGTVSRIQEMAIM